jgi:signal transduction histidine kinase
MTRVPVTARIAALSMLLALLSNLALLGFVHLRTHDDELGGLRQNAIEQSDVLGDVYRSGGRSALGDAIADSLGDDPEMVATLVGSDGKAQAGNLSVPLAAGERRRAGFQVMPVRIAGQNRTVEAGIVTRPLKGGAWLLSGRLLGERLALQRTLERSLLLAVALAVALGLLCGLLIARYVGLRVRAISAVIDEVGEGDLTRRADVRGDGDAFDTLSARINHMLERVAALMDELRLLTDSLAHDLRSPVSRLRARVERALITEDQAQREAMLAGVLDEADALTRMLTTVLEIGRSEAMTGRKRFTWVDPNELMGELAEMYEPLAEEAGVVLALDRRGVALPLLGHRQLLAQAMSNLIDNALSHGSSGGRIMLVVVETGDILRMSVADRGPGIAAGDEAEARRRFGRLDTARSAPGAGLGLALVEAVAHLHGGRLELADERPGLCATLVLPCRRVVPEKPVGERSAA